MAAWFIARTTLARAASPAIRVHLGVGIAQKPSMQTTPLVGVPQQSLRRAHFSSTFEQVGGGEMH